MVTRARAHVTRSLRLLFVLLAAALIVVGCGDSGGDGQGGDDTRTGEDVVTGNEDTVTDEDLVTGEDAATEDSTTPNDVLGPDAEPGRDVTDEDTVDDPCVPNPCDPTAHRGVCTAADEEPGYVCSCDAGYEEDGDGECVEIAVTCTTDDDCQDGVFCNGHEKCRPDDPDSDDFGCSADVPRDPDDGNPCTEDSCDEENDTIVNDTIACFVNSHCEDGACVCDPGYEENEVGNCVPADACVPGDPQEENDTPETAAPLDGALGMRLGIDPSDEDWYSVRTCAGGTMTIDAFFDGLAGDVNIYLYAADGATLLTSSEGDVSDEQIVWNSDRDGVVLLRVASTTGTCVRYSLRFSLEGCQACVDDRFEPNDSQDAAAAIDELEGEQLVFTSGSPDWWRIPTCAGQELDINVVYQTGNGNIDVRLMREGQDTPLASAYHSFEGQTLNWRSDFDGEVLLHIDSLDSDMCLGYELRIGATSCESTGTCEDDALEDNDTPETAASLLDARDLELGVIPGNDDWFKIHLCASEWLYLGMFGALSGGQATATLYAADATTVLEELSPIPPSGGIEFTPLEETDVYLRISTTREDACDSYSLGVSVSGCDSCIEDEGEEDDSAAEAHALTAGSGEVSGILCGTDEDWLAIDVCGGGLFELSIFAHTEEGQIEASLIAADGATELGTFLPNQESELFSARGLTPGLHYVRLRALVDAGFPGLPYTYRYDGVECCELDGAEPNDTTETAFPTDNLSLPDGGDMSLRISEGEEDWYVTTVPATTEVTWQLEFSPDEANLDLYLYAGDGETLLASSTSTDSVEEITFMGGDTDGAVYINVVNVSGYCAEHWLMYIPSDAEQK